MRTRGAAPYVPATTSLAVLAEAAQACRGCALYQDATQAVFGAGRRAARLLLVGEQPGDQEDLQGRPFVGPAGALLARALGEAGIDRADVFLTNAVKHFKWEPRGKRRIHKKPRVSEIRACRPWLEAELRIVRPAVTVALGATAARSLLGSGFTLMASRGSLITDPTVGRVVATIHPSAVLRARDSRARTQAYARLVADLAVAYGAIPRNDEEA
jgi:uracil-DNA glycosylase